MGVTSGTCTCIYFEDNSILHFEVPLLSGSTVHVFVVVHVQYVCYCGTSECKGHPLYGKSPLSEILIPLKYTFGNIECLL